MGFQSWYAEATVIVAAKVDWNKLAAMKMEIAMAMMMMMSMVGCMRHRGPQGVEGSYSRCLATTHYPHNHSH